MTEIRLICPDCGTEYQIPEIAVPEGGRDVECSECGRIWHAERPGGPPKPREMGVYAYNFREFKGLTDPQGIPLPIEPAQPLPGAASGAEVARETPPEQPAGEAPSLNRPLPGNVLNILLEAVEHERQARQADDMRHQDPDLRAAAAKADEMLQEPDWPATTVTGQWDAPEPEAAPDQPEPSADEPASPDIIAAPAEQVQPEPAPAEINTLPALTPSPPRNRYWQGFAVAIAMVAALLALYLLAPAEGPLADIRNGLDQARLWLQNAVDGPGN